jgi:hypothetical protein
MTSIHRPIDAEAVAIRLEIDRTVLGQARGEAVTRRRLRGVGTDDRTDDDQQDEPEENCQTPAAHLAERLTHLA